MLKSSCNWAIMTTETSSLIQCIFPWVHISYSRICLQVVLILHASFFSFTVNCSNFTVHYAPSSFPLFLPLQIQQLTTPSIITFTRPAPSKTKTSINELPPLMTFKNHAKLPWCTTHGTYASTEYPAHPDERMMVVEFHRVEMRDCTPTNESDSDNGCIRDKVAMGTIASPHWSWSCTSTPSLVYTPPEK